MKHKLIIKHTFRRFYIPTAIGALLSALMQILNLVFASLFFGQDGSLTIGLVLPLNIFIELIAYLFGIGGGTAISAYVGKGSKKAANGAFTASVLCTVIMGAIATGLGLLLFNTLMSLLGAGDDVQLSYVKEYVRIMICCMPILLISSVLNILVRNDNRPIVAMMGIIIASVVNTALILVFVGILKYDIKFIAISTAASHFFASLFYLIHFFSRHSNLKLTAKIERQVYLGILKPGCAGAMIFFAQMMLTIYINRILMETGGYTGIAIYCIIKYIATFIYAIYDGINHSAQPMLSVYFGEKDIQSIIYTVKSALKILIIESLAIIIILSTFAPFISSFFNTDVNIAVYMTAATCLFSSVNAFFNSYYRSVGKETTSLMLLVLNNLVFPVFLVRFFVIEAVMYKNGIWLALLISEALTFIVMAVPIIATHGQGIFKTNSGLNDGKTYDVIINPSEADVMSLNSDIEQFCLKNNIDAKKQYYIFLCIEEIAVNIINHGLKNGKGHYINIRITAGDNITLTIRDDAVKYDPTLKVDANGKYVNKNDDNLGIFLVKKIAKEFSYKRVIGFNSLYVSLAKKNELNPPIS